MQEGLEATLASLSGPLQWQVQSDVLYVRLVELYKTKTVQRWRRVLHEASVTVYNSIYSNMKPVTVYKCN